MTRYYETPEYRSAVAHPFHVSLYADWSDAAHPITVGFQTEDEARAFAASRPEPLIDLVKRDHGVIAARRMVAHNPQAGSDYTRDDFPQDAR